MRLPPFGCLPSNQKRTLVQRLGDADIFSDWHFSCRVTWRGRCRLWRVACDVPSACWPLMIRHPTRLPPLAPPRTTSPTATSTPINATAPTRTAQRLSHPRLHSMTGESCTSARNISRGFICRFRPAALTGACLHPTLSWPGPLRTPG